MDQKYETVALDALIEHPKNPRKGDVGAIKESIQHNGFYGACIVQRSTMFILAGNHRARAAKASGLTEIPALIVDVDDATALRILLADNRTSDLATNEDALLLDILRIIREEEASLLGTGYADDDVEQIAARLAVGAGDGSSQLGEMQYRIMIECKDEDQQRSLIEKFEQEGLECRALIS